MMTLPSILGIVVFLVGPPLVALVLIAQPRWRPFFAGLLAFSTCFIMKPFYQEVFFQEYRGVDRGFGVTITDVLFFGFALFLGSAGGTRKKVWWPYNTGIYLLLILMEGVSLIGSPVPLLGAFSLHKFLRGLVLFWVVVNLIQEKKDLKPLLVGLVAAIVFQFLVVFVEKYVLQAEVVRSNGTFPHPNSLAMYMNMLIPIFLALLLVGTGSRNQDIGCAVAALLGTICVIFSKSRASLALLSATLVFVPAMTFSFRPSKRVIGLSTAGFLVLVLVGAAAAPRILNRFMNAPSESAETRAFFNSAALQMAADHPFGVGFNAFAWSLTNTDYYWLMYPDKVNVDHPQAFRDSPGGKDRLGTAHHVYLLFAAETGWYGMAVFILLLLRFLWKNYYEYVRARDYQYKAILVGLLAGVLTLHFQGLLEWIFRQTQVFYLFLLLTGMMVAIGRLQKRPRRPVPALL